MIVIDASVLIAHLEGTDAHHDKAKALLLSISDSPIVASPITLAEVLVEPTRVGQLARAEAGIEKLRVKQVPFPPDAPTRLANLRARSRLKLPDCCVLLAAEQINAKAIATFDDQLGANAQRLGFKLA